MRPLAIILLALLTVIVGCGVSADAAERRTESAWSVVVHCLTTVPDDRAWKGCCPVRNKSCAPVRTIDGIPAWKFCAPLKRGNPPGYCEPTYCVERGSCAGLCGGSMYIGVGPWARRRNWLVKYAILSRPIRPLIPLLDELIPSPWDGVWLTDWLPRLGTV